MLNKLTHLLSNNKQPLLATTDAEQNKSYTFYGSNDQDIRSRSGQKFQTNVSSESSQNIDTLTNGYSSYSERNKKITLFNTIAYRLRSIKKKINLNQHRKLWNLPEEDKIAFIDKYYKPEELSESAAKLNDQKMIFYLNTMLSKKSFFPSHLKTLPKIYSSSLKISVTLHI